MVMIFIDLGTDFHRHRHSGSAAWRQQQPCLTHPCAPLKLSLCDSRGTSAYNSLSIKSSRGYTKLPLRLHILPPKFQWASATQYDRNTPEPLLRRRGTTFQPTHKHLLPVNVRLLLLSTPKVPNRMWRNPRSSYFRNASTTAMLNSPQYTSPGFMIERRRKVSSGYAQNIWSAETKFMSAIECNRKIGAKGDDLLDMTKRVKDEVLCSAPHEKVSLIFKFDT